MHLHDDDFTLFQLPRQFAQDPAEIDARWKALQRQAHPDKFAAQGAAAQRLAMQWSVRINEARARLADPLQRATYLCHLGGVEVDAESNTAMPGDFLMQQMQWREALDEATDAASLHTLHTEVQQAHTATVRQLQTAIDQQHDLAAAASHVRRLLFIQKFAHDVQQRQRAAAGA